MGETRNSARGRPEGSPVAQRQAPPALRRIAADDRAALVARAWRLTGSRPDAEDAVHDAVLKALLRSDELRDERRTAAWLARIVERQAQDGVRIAHRAQRRTDTEVVLERIACPPTATALCVCARAQVAALRPAYSEVVLRVDEAGEPPVAVARALGLSVNALTVRLFRARVALRALIEAHCGTTKRSLGSCLCAARGSCGASSSLEAPP